MNPWWLTMLGGLLGSAHCVGMCGGFAAVIGLNTKSTLGNLRAQLVYSCGRLMSYATLGAIAGFAGQRISHSAPAFLNIPAVFCLIAGVFLVREGLLAAGWCPRRISGTSLSGCLLAPMFSAILKMPGLRNTFVAGIITGLLPCGLVYAFVSLAASSGDLLAGITTMLAFGFGTVPLMVITGCSAALLSWGVRQRLWQLAAWSVVLTGLLTIGRGISFLQLTFEPQVPSCPFCAASTAHGDEQANRPHESSSSPASSQMLISPRPSQSTRCP